MDPRTRLMVSGSPILLGVLLLSCTSHARLESLREARQKIQAERRTIPPLPGLEDLKGVVHVHSRLSWDGRGAPEEVLTGARQAGLRWLMTTDDNTPRTFSEGPQGRQGDLVVIRGVQVTYIHSALLVFNLASQVEIPYWESLNLHETLQSMIALMKAKGGIVFLANPARFQDWSVTGYDGMEIYNFADDAGEWKNLARLPKYLFDVFYSYDRFPEELLLQFVDYPARPLARWDSATQSRRVVGIAGSDAHQNIRLFGRSLDPYGRIFGLVTTHLLAARRDERAVLEALREGHAYVAFDQLADATGFRMTADDGTHRALMGDAVPLSPSLRLSLEAPHTGWIRVFQDGQLISEVDADRWEAPVTRPGTYRVEVWLRIMDAWRPWILSNPVYVMGR